MDLHTIIEGLDYLSQTANKSVIMMNNMIVLSVELLLAFIARFFILLKINSISPIKTAQEHERQKTIIINHLGYEVCLALLISWLLMVVMSSVEINYVINLIISPIVGILGGITLDNLYILPRQNRSLYITSAPPEAESEHSAASHEPITININSDNADSADRLPTPKALPHSIATSSDFNIQLIDFVNELYQTVEDIRESEMIERKMWLKSEMYRCLGNGFATPAEHDKIRGNYHAYVHLLKGNGDVKNLYENHFEHLGVHEDRRKSQQRYDGENRRINRNCEYGQYDSEYNATSEEDTLNNFE